MNYTFTLRLHKGLVGAALLCLLPSFSARAEDVTVNVQVATIEGGEASPIHTEPMAVTVNGQSLAGLRATFGSRSDVWPALIFPAEVSAATTGTLVFTAKFEGSPSSDLSDFEVWVLDVGGNWVATTFSQNTTPLTDGWSEFRWDVKAAVAEKGDTTLDVEHIAKIWIRYNFPAIPAGESVNVLFAEMKFIP